MKRRTFFAVGASIVVTPMLVRHGFAQDRPDDGRGLIALSRTYRAAQRDGRPLLVLVVPAEGSIVEDRGMAFGELLNHGGDEVLAELALAEVACAPMAVLRRLVPQAGEGEPLMVVIETERVPAAVRRLEAELPPSPVGLRWQADEIAREEGAIDRRIAILRGLIHRGLAADRAMLDRRAARYDPARRERVRSAAATGAIAPGMAAWAPAEVLLANDGRPSARLVHDLAESARERLVRGQIAGSTWASSTGCGIEFEGQPSMVDCGMGHVPGRSSRFLYWLTR